MNVDGSQVSKNIDDGMRARIAIIIKIIIQIIHCSYSEAREIILKSETFIRLKQGNYSTLYDSPQANLSSIGEELRRSNNRLGLLITDDNIRKAMLETREANLKRMKHK